jgi:hypothetical protein
MVTKDISKGIIAAGNPNCKHREKIMRNDDRHEIGVCVECGRTKDYTILRGEDVWMVKGKCLKGDMNMNLMMLQAKGKRKPKNKPKNIRH